MTQPAPLTSTTFVDGELTNEAKWYSRVFIIINWLLAQFGDTGWTTASLGNSWVSDDGGAVWAIPAYRKLNGVVFAQGLMKNGTTGSTVFTFPVGMRPIKQLGFIVQSNTGAAWVTVTAAGVVSVAAYTTGGGNAFVSLNQISFIAEQ